MLSPSKVAKTSLSALSGGEAVAGEIPLAAAGFAVGRDGVRGVPCGHGLEAGRQASTSRRLVRA